MKFGMTTQIIGLSTVFLMSSAAVPAYAEGTQHTIQFDLNGKKTYVDEKLTSLDVPPALIHNHLFVPVRFLSENLGFQVNWDEKTNVITIQAGNNAVTIDSAKNQATINNQTTPFDSVGVISKNRLLLATRTMANLVNVPIDYSAANHVVTIKPTASNPVPAASAPIVPANHPPVAKFETDKETYRIGEPIQYTDKSSDPDSDPVTVSWQGNDPAFFTAGDHVVTLTAKDSKGAVSQFSKTIHVSDQVLTTKDEYPFYFGNSSGDPKALPIDLDQFVNYRLMQPEEVRDITRKLIFSDSPEIFNQNGILYQDKVTGKNRLYLTSQNGLSTAAKVNVIITNPGDQPITIQTTRKGDSPASYHAEIIGSIALLDWYKTDNEDPLVVQPGQSIVYYQSPNLQSSEAVNSVRDFEVTGGDADLTVAAMGLNDDPLSYKNLPILQGYDGHDRGTFSVSGFQWDVDGTQLQGKPASIAIGDEGRSNKQWIFGTDAPTGNPAQDLGNYGVLYDLTIHSPGKAVICLVPLGGYYKGSVLYNDQVVNIPSMGGIDRGIAYVIGKTTGNEDQVHLQFMPPSGTFLPFNILIYPLDDRK